MKRNLLVAASAIALALGASSASAKNFELKLSYWVPPSHPLTPGYEEWAKEIAEKTGGTVTVKLFPTSQLGSGKDHYDMVKRGIADFGLINPGYTPGRFPVYDAINLPFTVSDSLKGAPGMTRFYQKYAPKEMPDQIVCHAYAHEPGSFHTSKKQIKVPADVKGMNIRTANHIVASFVTSMGGNSVQVPIMEAKDTLAKGITDGITVPLDALLGTFKFHEVTDYTLDAPLYVSGFTHGLSHAQLDKMSDEQRNAVMSTCTPEGAAKIYRFWHEDASADNVASRKLDHTWYKPSAAELAKWKEAAAPVKVAWAQAVEKAGFNPGEVLSDLQAELKKDDALF